MIRCGNWSLVACLVVFLAGGCIPSNPDSESDSEVPAVRAPDAGSTGSGARRVSLDDYAEKMAESYCSSVFRCCRQTEAGALASRVPEVEMSSKQACIESLRPALISFYVAEVRKSSNADRVEYDPKRAATCINEVRDLSCSEIPNGYPYHFICREALTSKVKLGGTCEHDYDCQNGFCKAGSERGEPDHCMQRVPNGRRCDRNDLCQKGAYCDTEDSVCRPRKPVGADCQYDKECKTETCEQTKRGGEVCRRKGAAGDECFAGSDCKSGLCNHVSDSRAVCLQAPACTGD